MKIQLSDHFTYRKLIQFAAPSICMMIFTSVYSVIDGFFVSNFVGKTPFAAVNFIMPILMILGAVGTVFGTGGSALVAKTLGEGNREKANQLFSLFIVIPFVLGVVSTIAGELALPHIAALLGAEGELLEYCIIYGRIVLISTAPFMLLYSYQSFFVTAEKPHLGFIFSVCSGLINIALDALFIIVFGWGIEGAALATVISEFIGGLAPCVYFACRNSSLLKLGKTHFDWAATVKAATNGLSEFVSTISMSVVGMMYNIQLLKYAGENGVAAYGVIMYVNFLFVAIFIGYSIGTGPVFGFNYGAQNHSELKNLLRRSTVILLIFSIILFAGAEIFAEAVADIFVGYDADLRTMTITGFRIFSISFLMCGFNIFGSSFFTALNNGLISATISFMRTLLFELGAVLLLPMVFGLMGIWSSVIVAEAAALVLTIVFIYVNRKKYHYM